MRTASANGDIALGMGRGQISNLLMEYAGLDIYEVLKFLVIGDRRVPIRCAFGDFAVRDGVMTARALAFDTTDTIIVGEGSISLRDETLDLRLRPRPKDRSLLSLRSPWAASPRRRRCWRRWNWAPARTAAAAGNTPNRDVQPVQERPQPV